MAKKKLTPRQKEWETEYKKLRRRVRDWKRKFHAIPDLPQKPERITKRDIERLKQFKWKNISEAEKKQWRKEYEYRYENKMPEVYQPKPPYTPPTEEDFIKNISFEEIEHEKQFVDDTYYDEPDEDGYTDTIDSRAEIEAWIERTIDSIEIAETPYQGEIPGAREQLDNLVLNGADEYGDYIGFLAFLEDHTAQLTYYAELVMTGYRNPWKGDIAPTPSSDAALSQFATILNFNRPLSKEQSDALNQGGNAYWSPFYKQ